MFGDIGLCKREVARILFAFENTSSVCSLWCGVRLRVCVIGCSVPLASAEAEGEDEETLLLHGSRALVFHQHEHV